MDDKEITWSQLISDFTSKPQRTLKELGEMFAFNLQENWWRIALIIIIFIIIRKIVFSFVDFVVPRNLSGEVPVFAKSKRLSLWRSKVYRKSFQSRYLHRARTVITLTKSLLDPLMILIAILLVLGQLGLSASTNTTTLVIGAFTLAAGLGAQGFIKDIFAGITVLLGDVYAVGDYVDTQFGAAGTVKKIGLRLTTLEGTDGTIWFVRHSELSRVGNRTASRSMVITDVTLTWNEDDKHIGMSELKFAEIALDETVRRLAETLEGVDRVARDTESPNDPVSFKRIASVVPDLVPNMSADTLWDMKALSDDTAEHAKVEGAVKRILGRVPVFTKVETLGLVNSTVNSITLRLRITLPPHSSRSQAMAVLRRAVFETFIVYDVTPQFEEVPEGSIVLSNIDREN